MQIDIPRGVAKGDFFVVVVVVVDNDAYISSYLLHSVINNF